MSEIEKNRFYYTVTGIILFNFLVFIKISQLTWLPGFMDTWFFSKGLVYYKDFLQLHLPLPHIIVYPFLLLTNWNLSADPFLAVIVCIVSSLIIYKFLQKHVTYFANITSIIFFNLTYWYASTWVQYSGEAIIGIFLLLLFMRIYDLFVEESLDNKKLVIIGLLFSATFLSGQISSITLLTLSLIIIVKIYQIQKNMFKTLIKGLVISFWTLLPFILLIGYFAYKNALKDFLFWNFSYYINYAKLSQSTNQSKPWLEILAIFSPVFILIYSSLTKKLKKNKKILSNLLIISTLSTLPLIVKSIFHPHHYLFALPLLALCLGVCLDQLKKVKKEIYSVIFVLMMIIFVFIYFYKVYPWFTHRVHPGFKSVRLTDLNGDPPQKEAVEWIQKNTKAQNTILVIGDPLFYFRSNRLPANNRYSVLPWHYLPLDESKKVIEANLSDYIIEDFSYMNRLKNGWKKPEISDYLQELIDRCYKSEFSNDYWEVYHLKDVCN